MDRTATTEAPAAVEAPTPEGGLSAAAKQDPEQQPMLSISGSTPPPAAGSPRSQMAAGAKRHVFIEVRAANGLPRTEITGIDAYANVWHQHDEPPPVDRSRIPDRGGWSCCGHRPLAEPPVVADDSVRAREEFGVTKVVQHELSPRWNFTADCELVGEELGGGGGAGWVVIDVVDHDRWNDDECVGRVVIPLDEASGVIQEDIVVQKSFPLSWAPGQTSPWPCGSVEIRILVSSLQDGCFPLQKSYLLKSFDFLSLYRQVLAQDDNGSAASASAGAGAGGSAGGSAGGGSSPRGKQSEVFRGVQLTKAEAARLKWRLGEVLRSAFVVFDVDGDGSIHPQELMHVMALLGEPLSWHEVVRHLLSSVIFCSPLFSSFLHHSSSAQPAQPAGQG
jgi:hypothetical protein